MKRRDFSLALLASIVDASLTCARAKPKLYPLGRIPKLPCLIVAQPNQSAVLGLSGNGSAAVGVLRHLYRTGELRPLLQPKWYEAVTVVVGPDLEVIGRHGEVPRELLRPMKHQSWLAQDLSGVDTLIVLGNLSCPYTRRYLPGFLREASRLSVSSIVGVIEPWKVIDGKVRRPNSPMMRNYMSSLEKRADRLIVIQEDFACDAMLRCSQIGCGETIDEATDNALSQWNRAEVDRLAEVAIHNLRAL